MILSDKERTFLLKLIRSFNPREDTIGALLSKTNANEHFEDEKEIVDLANKLDGRYEASDLVVKFDNQKAIKHFATWLCESGEQDYWMWMEERETEDDDDITAVRFDYFNGAKKFMTSNVITAQCGRLTDND